MFRERGSFFDENIPSTRQQIEEGKDILAQVDASLLPENNPTLVAIFDRMGITYPTTPDEWRRAEEAVDRQTRELQVEARLAEEKLVQGSERLNQDLSNVHTKVGNQTSEPLHVSGEQKSDADAATHRLAASGLAKEREWAVQMERLQAAESRIQAAEAKNKELEEQLQAQPERWRQQDEAEDAAFEEKKRKLLEEIARLSE